MKKATTCFVTIMVLVVVANPVVHAQCPEGKQAVTMVTKSGIAKILCIPDNAVKGIENAAEHSSTTVVAAICPEKCWSPKDLEFYSTKYDVQCEDVPPDSTTKGGIYCYVYDPVSGIPIWKGPAFIAASESCSQCDNLGCFDPIPYKSDERDACVALLEPFMPPANDCPSDCWTNTVADLASKGDLRCERYIGTDSYLHTDCYSSDGIDRFGLASQDEARSYTCYNYGKEAYKFEITGEEYTSCSGLAEPFVIKEVLLEAGP